MTSRLPPRLARALFLGLSRPRGHYRGQYMFNRTGGIIMALPTRVQRGQPDPFESVQREFDTMLNRWLGGREANGGAGGAAAYLAPYAVDVREDADHIYVEAELPGFKKE